MRMNSIHTISIHNIHKRSNLQDWEPHTERKREKSWILRWSDFHYQLKGASCESEPRVGFRCFFTAFSPRLKCMNDIRSPSEWGNELNRRFSSIADAPFKHALNCTFAGSYFILNVQLRSLSLSLPRCALWFTKVLLKLSNEWGEFYPFVMSVSPLRNKYIHFFYTISRLLFHFIIEMYVESYNKFVIIRKPAHFVCNQKWNETIQKSKCCNSYEKLFMP